MALYDEDAFRWDERASLSHAWPRYFSLMLGCWLFVSAFLLPHTRDSCAASWIMGSAMAMNAFAAIWAAPARYFNVVLGLISLAWQGTAAANHTQTLVNGLFVSGLVVLLAFVPSREPVPARR